MQYQQSDLVVVIPVYNEQECIEEVITSWGDFLTGYLKTTTFKLLLINDGSKDNTPTILDQLANRLSYLQVVHQKNGGHGNAVLNGYHESLKYNPQWVFQVDSDNQFLPADFPKLWESREKSNFILGYRKKRYDDANRLVITRIVRVINLLFFGVFITDSNVPYRLIKGDYLPKLLNALHGQPFAPNIFLSVLAKRDGNDLMSIPVTHKERETGQVSIIKWKLLKVCFRTAGELFNFSFTLKKRLKSLKGTA
ncbi:MAG TPA: glycosyltransferase family 2 protein [Flavipsychrobacter sp.]|nr:glycosyltransferase family 2 protein [Flavipsychrobacter sp.]